MPADTVARRLVWLPLFLLLVVVGVFAVLRLVVDLPHLLGGTLPEAKSFDRRYVEHAWIAYTHIAPGILYLLLAPIQLWRGFRNRHLRLHRRIGRVALTAGVVSGLMAVLFGSLFPWGGFLEGSAAVVFGAWFVVSLVRAYAAIRAGDVVTHRRFMIRAFAVGLGVGTIRIWIGLLTGFGLLGFPESFGPAFWLGLGMHVLAAELWLRWRPAPDAPAGRAAQPASA